MKKCLRKGSRRQVLRDERGEKHRRRTKISGAKGEDLGRARAVCIRQQQQCLIRPSRAEQCTPLPLHTTDLPVRPRDLCHWQYVSQPWRHPVNSPPPPITVRPLSEFSWRNWKWCGSNIGNSNSLLSSLISTFCIPSMFCLELQQMGTAELKICCISIKSQQLTIKTVLQSNQI